MIFSVLETILLRVVDDLGKHTSTGQSIVNQLLTSYASALYSMLKPTGLASHIKRALKLLSSMVLLGESSAKTVLTHFDISHSDVIKLFKRRDTKV